MEPMRYITRMDYDYENKSPIHGWWVRFWHYDPIKKRSKMVAQKMFYDHHYEDGKKEALFWAQEWRDWKVKELGLPPTIVPYKDKPQKNNKSGIVGVYYTEYMANKYDKRKGLRYRTHVRDWVASWCENGQPKTKKFSVGKWGYNTAFHQAVDWRKKMEKKLIGAIK